MLLDFTGVLFILMAMIRKTVIKIIVIENIMIFFPVLIPLEQFGQYFHPFSVLYPQYLHNIMVTPIIVSVS